MDARELGLPLEGEPGEYNAITDVPGVQVGYSTIIEGEGALEVGKGPIRTGVTAILPRGDNKTLQPVWAGMYALNGNGEMTGTHWIHDAGYFLSPICISNTHAVGTVHHSVTKWMISKYQNQYHNEHLWIMPVVAETYDGILNDINGLHVREEHVFEALNTAKTGEIEQGNVGGGTGMICYEFKGGTGTSSRKLEVDGETYHVGVLVQANHGKRDWFRVAGVPVGKHLTEDILHGREMGSIIVVIGTNIPMLPHQLKRMAKRAAIGIGRSGTPGGNDSGDIFLAFSTANEMEIPHKESARLNIEYINDEWFDPIYEQTVHAVDEAIINAMVSAEDMTTLKPEGRIVKAINHNDLVGVLKEYKRI